MRPSACLGVFLSRSTSYGASTVLSGTTIHSRLTKECTKFSLHAYTLYRAQKGKESVQGGVLVMLMLRMVVVVVNKGASG